MRTVLPAAVREAAIHAASSLAALRPAFRAVLPATILLAACASAGRSVPDAPPEARDNPEAFASPAPSRRLAPAEILEYRGERLGSIDDFPDNSILGPQVVDPILYRLAVDGLVGKTLSLAYDEVLALPLREKAITLQCVEGWSVRALWEGPLVADLVDAAQPDPEATTLILEAVDGYTTTMSLAFARERGIILAARLNGVALPPERGFPFQLAAEDKWGYKWIKWVKRITLSVEADYRGYWERQGYNQDGSLDGPRFEPGPPPADQWKL